MRRLAEAEINVVWDDKVIRPAANGQAMFFQNIIVNRRSGLESQELTELVSAIEAEFGGHATVAEGVQLSGGQLS
ncbi:hypothetical protein OAH18_01275 [bacterium]|nr:hypothetical protein [bacterium]